MSWIDYRYGTAPISSPKYPITFTWANRLFGAASLITFTALLHWNMPTRPEPRPPVNPHEEFDSQA